MSRPRSALPHSFARAWYGTCLKVRWADWRDAHHKQHAARDHYSLAGVLAGRLALRSYKFNLVLAAGEAAILPPGFGHTAEAALVDGACRVLEVGFSVEAADGMADALAGLPLPCAVRFSGTRPWRVWGERLTRALSGRAVTDRLRARPHLDQLLADYLACGFEQGVLREWPHRPMPEWLQAAEQVIVREYRSPQFDLARLAQILGVSLGHLKRAFRDAFGTPPGARLRSVRLENASRMLRSNPELSIGEVAGRCGYARLTSFDRAFVRHYGVPPSALRSRRQP